MEPEFNFFQNWYPLSPLEDLDPKKPTPVTLLGMGLVIWKQKSTENYQVFLDQCPHRLAPLSEGLIEKKTGNLMCSYHGWQFDAKGTCTRIPQAEKPELITQNQDNFCAVVFPSRHANDLLWVWADAHSPQLAAQTPLPLSPQIDASQGFVWSSFVRDLEYDWQTLVENVADPSHVPFSHHGVQGNRERANPITFSNVESTPNLIQAMIEDRLNSTITFEPPCRLEYAISIGKDQKRLGLVTYCLPVSPGKSRIVAQFPRNFAKTLHALVPRWWNHITIRNSVLDGDMILLHYQERLLQQKQRTQSWKTAYKMPTSADRLVIEFRKWFDKYCGGKLPWQEVGITVAELPPMIANRQEILNRYQQHTQHCRSCRNALKLIKRLQLFLLADFWVTVVVVALMPDNLRLEWGLLLMVIAIVGLGFYSWLKLWLEPRFYFIDYVHSEKP
ncbi:MAG: Rieske 2Fe-2S domain-containing protein [Symploca sp. SIO3E6]|nr:Rieske 2Fe-2S domain-containing protein [Caldora sp. SIO3E6]